MKNSFDRILTSTPVNKTAAVVAGGKGEHWTSKRRITQLHWDAPPKCERLPKGVTDLFGTVFGRLTVLRYYGSSDKRGSIWLVRCVCGNYETRSRRAVANPNNGSDCCQHCRQLIYIKKRDGQSAASAEPGKVRSLEPLPVRPFDPSGQMSEDLTGKTVGNLSIIGRSALEHMGASGSSRWVVRCDCGVYELRNGKYLRRILANPTVDGGTMCDACAKVKGFHWRKSA